MVQIGAILDGRYRVDYVIKQGGMGTVYGAHDLRLDRECAVKAVPASSPQDIALLQRESRVLARLCHPHLPAIYDCLEGDSTIYVIMQMIPGDDLEAITVRAGPPSLETLVRWALQLAEVVHYLHEQSPAVIHRDIKPANIRLAPHGEIYLVDFGIAKVLDGAATLTAARAASVPYAPIEQLQDGSHTDQQSDIYAYGATLYRLLTATLPPSCIDRLVGKDLAPISSLNPSVPEQIEILIHHCMELWSADRPASMASVITALNAARGGAIKAAGAPRTRSIAQGGDSGGPVANSSRAPRPQLGPPPAAAVAALEQGQRALEEGEPAVARAHFTRAIEASPGFAEAFAARATAYERLELDAAAIDDWTAALSLQPRRAAWLLRRGRAHRRRGEITAALSDISAAIEMNPEETEAYLERAVVRHTSGDTRGQLQDLDRLLSLDPHNHQGRVARIHARMEQQLWQAALLDCNALVQSDPRDPSAYLLRARVHTELADTTRALRDLGEALARESGSAEAYFLRGRLLQRMGDRPAALRDFNLALTLDPEHVEAQHRRAQVYRVMGAEHDALSAYRTLLRALRARCARGSGSNGSGASASRRGPRPIAVEIEYLMQTGGLDKARKYLHAHATSFREESDEELEERAALFERVGQIGSALDDLERAVKLVMNRQRQVALSVA